MILVAGSRGPVLFIAEIVIVYYLVSFKTSKYKLFKVLAMVFAAVVIYVSYDYILLTIGGLLSNLGIKSRFFTKLLNGSVMDDNGRNKIWSAAIGMIKENPYGYGAMGSRHVITSYIYTGYPHNIILEFLIDYGVIPGAILLGFMLFHSIKIIFFSDSEWKNVFIPFFCASCGLLISLTYWSVPTYWTCLAIGYNCYLETRKDKKNKKDINYPGKVFKYGTRI